MNCSAVGGETVNTGESEQFFEEYLQEHRLDYQRDFFVDPGNVDFCVTSNSCTVLCDVKEIRDPVKNVGGELYPYHHIRKDIKKLRKKFGKNRPNEPCVLVSMNFSERFFTGFTVVRAMLGDVGVAFDKTTKQIISDVHRLPRGNAAMTKQQNRSMSGVLVFDCVDKSHRLFTNPFADRVIPHGFFPVVQVISLKRESLEDELTNLSGLMFHGCG